jgi:hypothetical protein
MRNRGNFLRFCFNHRSFVNFLFLVLLTGVSCVSHTLPGPVDCHANPIVVALVSAQDTDCGLNEGMIEVAATGGSGIYRYSLNEGDDQPGSVFSALAAGVYNVTATDALGCSASIEVTVKNKAGLNLAFETSDAGCKSAGGTIHVIPRDGVPPYLFKMGSGDSQTSDTFAGLAPGQYNITVSDATGCEVRQGIRVSSGIRFSTDVSPIIATSCAITGCHNGTQFPDLRVFSNIRANAGMIKKLTGDRTMPQDGTLIQAQINAIACWVDDGAPDN